MVMWLLLNNFSTILYYLEQSSLCITYADIKKLVPLQFVDVLISFTQYHLVLVSSFSIFKFSKAYIHITNSTKVQSTKCISLAYVFLTCRLVWTISEVPPSMFVIAKINAAIWFPDTSLCKNNASTFHWDLQCYQFGSLLM